MAHSNSGHDMWRPLRSRRSLIVIGLLLVLGYLAYGHPARSRGGSSHGWASGKGSTSSWSVGGWKFNANRDRDNHSLTPEQCDATFPKLYHEIDRARDYWRQAQGGANLTPNQLDLDWSFDGGLRGMIYDNQLYITYSRGLNHFRHWEERSKATLAAINRAILASPYPIPNIEFTIKINDKIDLTPDRTEKTVWAFSRNISDPVMDRVWVIPDFNFWAYPRVAGSFGSFQRESMAIEHDSFAQKRGQLVWRGTLEFNWELRTALLKQSEGQAWSDVRELKEDAQSDFRISMPDHCRYKYAVHTEGTTWSGRLKYLLSCHSVVFIHHLSWYTHLYHLLIPSGPEQNYVQAENDWSDLPVKIEDLIDNPAKAEMIADNAAATFRDLYFTPAAQTCYWRKLFAIWRDITYEPEPFEEVTNKDGSVSKVIKGMSYEEYIFYKKEVGTDGWRDTRNT